MLSLKDSFIWAGSGVTKVQNQINQDTSKFVEETWNRRLGQLSCVLLYLWKDLGWQRMFLVQAFKLSYHMISMDPRAYCLIQIRL